MKQREDFSGDYVSIIVPVYNAESTVLRVIECLRAQSYEAIEIILINDGSTDKSGAICEQYAQTDARIRVIHQQNKGPSAARNAGVNIATGTFIQFLDADDYIEPFMTEKLVQAIDTRNDLVICGYKSISQTNVLLRVNTPIVQGVFNLNELMQHIGQLYEQIILSSLCNKLYRTTIIKKFDVQFNEHLKMGEDLLFNIDYIQQCNEINVIPDLLYHYLTGNNASLSSIYHPDLFDNQNLLHKQMSDWLTENNCYTGENKYFMDVIYTNSVMNSLHNIFHQQSDIQKKQRNKQIEKIITNSYLKDVIEKSTDNRQQTRLIKRLIKKKSIVGIQTLLLFKQTILQNAQPVYRWMQKRNRA